MSSPSGRPVGPRPRALAILAGVAYLCYLVAVEPAVTVAVGTGLTGELGRDGVQLWAVGFAAGVAGLWAVVGTRA